MADETILNRSNHLVDWYDNNLDTYGDDYIKLNAALRKEEKEWNVRSKNNNTKKMKAIMARYGIIKPNRLQTTTGKGEFTPLDLGKGPKIMTVKELEEYSQRFGLE